MDIELIKGTLSVMVLTLLNREPMYGYQIVSRIRECTNGAFEWTPGALYPSLHKMEAGGLIEGEWAGEAGTRRRKYYRITDAGRKVLLEKTEAWKRLCRAMDQVMERGNG